MRDDVDVGVQAEDLLEAVAEGSLVEVVGTGAHALYQRPVHVCVGAEGGACTDGRRQRDAGCGDVPGQVFVGLKHTYMMASGSQAAHPSTPVSPQRVPAWRRYRAGR